MYVVSAVAPGYVGASQHVTLSGGPLPTLEIWLESLGGILEGQVTDVVSGAGLAGASVSLGQLAAVTDSSGRYRLGRCAAGARTRCRSVWRVMGRISCQRSLRRADAIRSM